MPFTPFGRGDKFFSQNAIRADQILGGTITAQEIVLGGANALLRSQNFVSGTSGWLIDGVGNAEFNDVTIRGELIGPSSGGYTMYFGVNGWRIEHSGGSIPFIGGPDSSGNFVLRGDGTANEADFIDFSSGIYIGPSSAAVPQAIGIVIEHSGTPSSSDTSILVRGDLFGTPVVLFQLDGDGVAKFSAGSAASPTITFATDSDTGFFRQTTDVIGVSSGGTEIGVFGVNVWRGSTTTGNFWLVHGGGTAPSVSNPTYAFYGDTDTGLYRVAADQIGVSLGGSRGFTLSTFGSGTLATNLGGSAFGSVIDGIDNAHTGFRLKDNDSNDSFFVADSASAVLLQMKQGGNLFLPAHTTTANAANFWISSTTGETRRSTSSREAKRDIRTLGDDLPRFRPVEFRSKFAEVDGDRLFAGFIAEEVAEAYPLAASDDGVNYDVRAIVAVHEARIQRLERTIAKCNCSD